VSLAANYGCLGRRELRRVLSQVVRDPRQRAAAAQASYRVFTTNASALGSACLRGAQMPI